MSYNTNEIDYMAEAVTVASAAATGHPINTPFGYAADGFYDVTDFNADGSLKEGMPVPTFGFVQPGDIKYKDLFGDGVIDENDKTKIGGASMPKYNFALQLGFSWRNLDLFALFQGVADRDVNLLNTPQAPGVRQQRQRLRNSQGPLGVLSRAGYRHPPYGQIPAPFVAGQQQQLPAVDLLDVQR